MPQIILFDLYDTILKDISFDFSLGLIYLHENFFTSACSFEEGLKSASKVSPLILTSVSCETDLLECPLARTELQSSEVETSCGCNFKELTKYAESFLPLYEKRKYDCTEICLIKDEIPLFFEKFNVAKPESFSGEEFSEIEYAVMNAMQKVMLTNEARDTLDELKKIGVEMYILSNSIFTGKAAERLLSDFGILHFFKKIFSSADYKIRKPSTKFFQIAIDEILSALPTATKDDILYVGNDYETDVIGGTGAGLKTVWYNVAHLENRENFAMAEIDDFRNIVEIVKESEKHSCLKRL